jgi:ketoreductase RED2
VNVIGTWQMITAALPHLRLRVGLDRERLLGGRGTAGGELGPLCGQQGRLNHMTRLLAAALGPGVRVNAVAPRLIETSWTTGWADGFAQATEWVKQSAPQQRVGTPEEIVETILFLADAPYTTGEVLLADGGLNLRI